MLQRAIDSVLKQSHIVTEIIVVDDGSTDNTKEIIQDFPEIKYFYQTNSGVSSARNLGISKAQNEWMAFLDSDDTWHKNKLQEQVEFHLNNKNILISYTNEKWIVYFFGHELFYELEKLHKAWHDENNKIMELYNKHNRGLLSKFIHHHRIADEDLDKAKAYYDEVKRISKALTDKMETLKIRTESMSETRLLDEFPK